MKRAGIIGGGAWGTALACATARAGLPTTLWAREREVVEAINDDRENSVFLADIPLPDGITATDNMADLADSDFVLMVCPAQFMRPVSQQLAPHLKSGMPLVICAKGIEKTSGYFMSQVLAETAPGHPIIVLSGPTFASEVASGLPAAVTIAGEDGALLKAFAGSIGQPTFRTYWTSDVIGAQIGGALKNVLAVACGIAEGKKFGQNARAALITRGMMEMLRFAEANNAEFETLMGLCGLGDLILTCSSLRSRNMSFGKALGEGQTMEEILARRKTVAEGVHSAEIVHKLANDMSIDMPICLAVYQILYEKVEVDKAIREVLARPFQKEIA